MEILQRIMSLVTASALLLSGCGINDTSETGSGQTTGGDTVSEVNTGRTKADPSDITYASSYSFDKLTYGDIEKMEYSCLIEAETAKSNSGITIKTDKAGYSGEG